MDRLQRGERGEAGGFRTQDARPQAQAAETGLVERGQVVLGQPALRADRERGLRADDQIARADVAVRIERQAQSGRVVEQAAQSASFIGSASSGRRLRPHCSQAEAITASQCARRRSARSASSLTSVRSVTSGTTQATPSSVAFCRIQSIFSPRAMPWPSVMRSRLSRSGAVAASSTRAVTERFASEAELAGVLAAVAVEQAQRMAAVQAQHARDVFAGLDRQLHFAPGAQRLRHVDAGDAHGNLRGAVMGGLCASTRNDASRGGPGAPRALC